MIEWRTKVEINGEEVEVNVEAEANVSRQIYGADADGNRGAWSTEVDITRLCILDNSGRNVTDIVAGDSLTYWRIYNKSELLLAEQYYEERN